MLMRNQLSDELAGGDAGEPAKRLLWSRVLAGVQNRVVCVGEVLVAAREAQQAKELPVRYDWEIISEAAVTPK
jgi:hypothetical protein